MPNKNRSDRVQVMLNEEELEAIDEWRYRNFMPARAAAIRALIRLGMSKSLGQKFALHNTPSPRIGVLEADPALSPLLGPRADKNVLVLEDEFLIARGIGDILDEAGYNVLGPVGDAASALALIDEGTDAAVLDIKLADGLSVEVARALRDRGIPFVFCTAYSAKSILPPEFATAVVIDKLHAHTELTDALDRLMDIRVEPSRPLS